MLPYPYKCEPNMFNQGIKIREPPLSQNPTKTSKELRRSMKVHLAYGPDIFSNPPLAFRDI